MKKILLLILSLCLLLSLFASCSPAAHQGENQAPTSAKADETTTAAVETAAEAGEASAAASAAAGEATPDNGLRIGLLKGPTGMGAAFLAVEPGAGQHFEILAAPDELSARFMKGDFDIAALPANLAAILYSKNQSLKLLAVNTGGVLYLMGQGSELKKLQELKGKTLYAAGKGASPEYVLRELLKEADLDPEKDLRLEWKSEHSECVAALSKDAEAFALLPQPFVTVAAAKNPDLHIVYDLNKAWDAHSGMDNSLITGVLAVSAKALSEKPEAVRAFMEAYRASVQKAVEDPDAAAAAIAKLEIVPEAIARKALPYCALLCLEGKAMQERLDAYYQMLFAANPKAVGGQVPPAELYVLK